MAPERGLEATIHWETYKSREELSNIEKSAGIRYNDINVRGTKRSISIYAAFAQET